MTIPIIQTENYFYVLNAVGDPVLSDINTWAEWRATHDCQIGLTKVSDTTISTVYIGYDMSLFVGKPLLFETMIFGGRYDGWQYRYSTRAEAEAGHARAAAMVRGTS